MKKEEEEAAGRGGEGEEAGREQEGKGRGRGRERMEDSVFQSMEGIKCPFSSKNIQLATSPSI